MNIGFIKFSDGACEQGWNPGQMTNAVRGQIAVVLEGIAAHMRKGEFEDGGQYVSHPVVECEFCGDPATKFEKFDRDGAGVRPMFGRVGNRWRR